MKLIITVCVSVIVLILLIILAVAKPSFTNSSNRRFLIATTAVYLSGTLLIMILSIIMDKVPMIFVIISEVSILSVYIITFITIIRISKNIGEILKDVESGKIKGVEEDDKRESKESD